MRLRKRNFIPHRESNYGLMHLERPLPFIPDFLDLIPTPLIFLLEARQYCKDMQWLGNHRGHMDVRNFSFCRCSGRPDAGRAARSDVAP